MRRASVSGNGKGTGASDPATSGVDMLVLHIGKLLRHPAYRRESIVSALLLRHLPHDAGYAWHGEASLRTRLVGAGLDEASLDHLIRNVQAEHLRLRRPADA
ncbi:hypothetical protein MCBMB27_02959 [Methylobacterium phyllosphaerae]|jgi:hypothetical protein|uniref:Uncharacterized protein n=3 Tax=Methylobacterium TaxID=407 RepID=A0AAE8HY56_9HYPH|nr:hypothetical protein MCBMB27_02959 [Methylobacterium phyllosphaerae]AWV16493.1 hypothetical protein A3862_14105 [Methylobacterium sp. XJLW]KOX43831.1 hypothetical protein ADL19_26875 [Streptomyces purpurogeneiscleroticus]RUP15588.1 MAG: hypothetical protein EKK43_06120 [Methylobacterium sp.]SFV14846.1 hypothetical protein SAMN02799643_06178 [Methylobacterium sp. UNCCL125]